VEQLTSLLIGQDFAESAFRECGLGHDNEDSGRTSLGQFWSRKFDAMAWQDRGVEATESRQSSVRSLVRMAWCCTLPTAGSVRLCLAEGAFGASLFWLETMDEFLA
jgi:hypothetical protein